MTARGSAWRSALFYLPAVAWAAFLLALGGTPNLHGPSTDLPLDKLAHFGLYGTLGAFVVWGWRRSGRLGPLPFLLALAMLVGAADEVHQRSVPGRTSDIMDWVADTTGILTAAAALLRLGRKAK